MFQLNKHSLVSNSLELQIIYMEKRKFRRIIERTFLGFPSVTYVDSHSSMNFLFRVLSLRHMCGVKYLQLFL